MQLLSRAGIGFLFVMMIASSAVAENLKDSPYGKVRACAREDLLGHIFILKDFQENPPIRETLMMKVMKYHYLKFIENNHFGALATNQPMTDVKNLESALARSIPTQSFTLDKNGVMDFIKNDFLVQRFDCIAVVNPSGNFKKGDLVMSGFTKKGKTSFVRIYRYL